MAKEAEAHAEEDKKKREEVEARNLLDSAVYQGEKLKKDNGDKLTEEDVKTLDEAIDAAKKVQADDKADKDALEAAAKELSDKMMPIGAKMYEQASKDAKPEDGSAEGEGEDKKDDEAVEGEVVDDKEKKE